MWLKECTTDQHIKKSRSFFSAQPGMEPSICRLGCRLAQPGARHLSQLGPTSMPARSGRCPASRPAWAGWHAGSLGKVPGIVASLGRLACRLARVATRHRGQPMPAPMPVGSASQPARDPACAGSYAGSTLPIYTAPLSLGGPTPTVVSSHFASCPHCCSLKVSLHLSPSPIHLAFLPTSNPQI